MDDDPIRDEITREAIRKSDAALVIYRSDPFAGKTERDFVRDMKSEGLTRFFSIVNRMNGRSVDDRLKGFVWSRLVTDMQDGPKYQGQDFTAEDIYFVDCQKALEGVHIGNAKMIDEAGLGLLEEQLGEFLRRDRRKVHVTRWIQQADKFAHDLEGTANKLLKSIQTDQQQFQANYQAIQPKLEAIHKRGNRLPNIFDFCRKKAQVEVIRSFDKFVTQLPDMLTDEVRRHPLPSLDTNSGLQGLLGKVKTPFKQKQLAEEAAELVGKVFSEQVRSWEKKDIPNRLGPVIDDMIMKIQSDIVAIEKTLEEIDFELTGWQPEEASIGAQGPGTLERVGWAAGGLMLNMPGSMFAGGAMGWEGFKKGILIEISTIFVVALFTGSMAALFIVPALVSFIVTLVLGGRDADKIVNNIKDKTVDLMIWGDPDQGIEGIRKQIDRARPQLEEKVNTLFEAWEAEIVQEVDSVIAAKEQDIRVLLEANSRGIEEKKILAAQTEEKLKVIVQNRESLRTVFDKFKQLV